MLADGERVAKNRDRPGAGFTGWVIASDAAHATQDAMQRVAESLEAVSRSWTA